MAEDQSNAMNAEADAQALMAKHDAMFQAAIRHVGANQVDQAEEICRQVLAADAHHPSTLHMLGVLYCQRGRLDAGVEYLERLARLQPDAAAPYFNYANALVAQGRVEEAVAQYQRALELEPENADIHVNLGNAWQRLNQLDEAESAYRRAIEVNPRGAAALNNLGNCLATRKQFAEAEQAFRRAAEADPRFAAAENNLGNALKAQGRLDEAIAAYRRAVALDNRYFDAFFSLGNSLSEQQNFEAAEVAYRRATELRPDHLDALINLASAIDVLDRPPEVINLCQRALRLDPNSVKALYLLANSYELTNRLDMAREVIDRALLHHPDHPDTNLIAARIDRRTGHCTAGIERLERLFPVVRHDTMAQAYNFELGRLYDVQDDPARAFDYFAAGNRIARAMWDKNNPGPASYRQMVERKLDLFTQDWVDRWLPSDVPESAAAPVFLVGFPRSGTTLLEQIFDSHPQVKALDEYPAVNIVAEELGRLPGGDPEALANLETQQIAALRNVYFSAVDQRISRRTQYRLIDKFPLNLVHAGLIHRLFPNARFIFALRHPLDACLSCFMQDFRLNRGVANFCDIESTAATYSLIMRLWQRYNDVLPLQVHTVRYETLVEDFETEVRRLLDFCDIGWDDSVLRFAEHSRERTKIKTPSYHQVSQPIYTEARYRWERYAEQLEPIRMPLAPFIEAFGYAGDTKTD